MKSPERTAKASGRRTVRAMSVAAAALAALSAGCAVGPDYHSPAPAQPMPPAWTGTQAPAPQPASVATPEPAVNLADWWTQFQDPKLTALVRDALKANLDLRQAESALREARAARGVTAAGLWPAVNAGGAFTRSRAPGGGMQNVWQAGLDAAWELDIFGGTRRAIEAADAGILAAQEGRNAVQVSLAAEVALNYVDLRGFQQRVRIARENLVAQRRNADLTRRRFDAGLVSALDVANADAQVATTESAIPPLETGARQAIYALSVLLARPPDALLGELDAAAPLPQVPGQAPVGLPSDLLLRRPDIRQSEALLHAATAQVGVAQAQYFPQISLTGNLGLESDALSSLSKNDNRFWSAGPSLTVPLFTAGRTAAQVEAQKALLDQAWLSYQKTVLVALQDVENALVAFNQEQRHAQWLDQAATANRKAVDLSLQLYTEGQTDFLNVITAQRSLYDSQDALVQSRQTVATNLIALYKALGGGWDVPKP